MSTERETPPMNEQLRELLCRIPCSPETDELQDFLTVYEQTIVRERDKAREREAKWRAVAEIYRSSESAEDNSNLLEILDAATEAFDALRSEVEG